MHTGTIPHGSFLQAQTAPFINHERKKRGSKKKREKRTYPIAGYETDHPDRLPDQVFIGNYTEEDFNKIEYTSKQLGSVAYRPDGRLCASDLNLCPVFVNRNEYRTGTKSLLLPEDMNI